MPTYSDPPEVDETAARRKAAWQMKAARIKARMEQENARLETLEENKILPQDDQSTELWLNGKDKVKHDCEQMEYARQYQADYHDFDQYHRINHHNEFSDSYANKNSIGSNDSEKNDTSDASNGTNLYNEQDTSNKSTHDNCSIASSMYEGSDIVEEMPARFLIARRGRKGRTPLSLTGATMSIGTRSIINDMERTSTIMPPTEPNGGEDFGSNVDVVTLKKKYFSNYKTTTNLPIYSYRSNLINSINTYNIVIIQGQTGCGKTTQVPAYILEDAIIDRNLPKAPVVYVTQPRRIAAKSIARRVADEHGWELGDVVGYQVGLDRCACEKTILTFCTAGVLLQKLINEKSLQNYSHIVIDEAHERDADTDLLMMMIRTLMRKEQSFFRLIVMSATIEVSKLKNYFTFKTTFGHHMITVPSICRINNDLKSAWQNEVQIVYMDRLSDNFRLHEKIPCFDLEQPEFMEECMIVAMKIIVEVIPNVDTFNRSTQTVLVFLPGLAEITKLHRMLAATKAALDIIPVHSSLPYEEQHRIFIPSENGYRKVILATNIAESSITVKDAGFIIDFCLTKTLKKDETTRFPMLKLDWCTRDKLIQRAGRTGRCCPGKVFRLITSNFYRALREYSEPELLVAPLELSILKVKTFDMGRVKALLAVVLDPPPFQDIKTAILELKQIGAMTATYEGKLSDEDGDLTELGRVISKLPIDVRLSKLIVIASLLDCLNDAIIVAASLSSNRNVVMQIYENPVESYLNKIQWSRESQSDLFVSIEVYKEYIYFKDTLQKDAKYMEMSCANKNLDERKLEEIRALREDLIFRLESQNIKILDQPNRVRDREEDDIMLKVAFCAAFFPNYYLNQELDPKMVERDLCGFDPTRTVSIHGLPVGSVPLYRTQILDQIMSKKSFKDVRPGELEYFADQSRALLRISEEATMSARKNINNSSGFKVDGIIQGEKLLFSLLKSSEHEPLVIREYRQDVAIDRMSYYQEARNNIMVPRLIPSLLRLVDRVANNNHLTVVDDEEYNRNLQEKFYTEVQFNQDQDYEDFKVLTERNNRLYKTTFSKTSLNGGLILDDDSIYAGSKVLRGPVSPIQMKFFSVLNKSKSYNVDICPNSVNSILLDSNYRKPRRQMLVAASVSQTQRSNRIIVRDTTLMPNIIGLPTIMSLLFARNYRLIYNELLRCYSGAIFSLGWDEDGKSLNKEYEIELDFDIHIIQDDLELINCARKNISKLIQFIDINNPGAPQASLQNELRKIIISLMKRRRYPLQPIDLNTIDWKEGHFKKDFHNQLDGDVIKTHDPCNKRYLFLPPLITTRNVQEVDLIQKLRQNIEHLDRIEKGEEPMPIGGVQCLLCGSGIGQVYIYRSKLIDHNFSDEHIRRYEQFEKSEERARLRTEI